MSLATVVVVNATSLIDPSQVAFSVNLWPRSKLLLLLVVPAVVASNAVAGLKTEERELVAKTVVTTAAASPPPANPLTPKLQVVDDAADGAVPLKVTVVSAMAAVRK